MISANFLGVPIFTVNESAFQSLLVCVHACVHDSMCVYVCLSCLTFSFGATQEKPMITVKLFNFASNLVS